MRDAITIKGKEIDYLNRLWVINEFYYVPNNPNIYIELLSNGMRLNVNLEDIKTLITKDE
jgi:hypothetical protein